LFEDWSGFGVSSFVIVAQTSQEKSPENLILSGDGQAQLAAIRAVLAMRLVAGGHVGTGHMFLMRPALFNVGIGGVTRSGWPRPPVYGPRYTLTPALIEPIVRLSGQLQALESTPSTGPGNLPLALRYFSESYERRSPTDAVVDLVTALEAVLGTETEISYRLSTRVAHLLASTEDERVHLFRTTKLWYDLRSAVVHGSPLKLKHQSLLADPEPLRQIVRRLLRGFIELAMRNDSPYGKQFFAEELESTLLSESKRALLQSAMGLNE
jgi:Apea-like HEPN